MRVQELIYVDRRWDVMKLKSCLQEEDVQAITSIPLSCAPMADKLIWLPEKTVVYYMRSGYRVMERYMDATEEESTSRAKPWWNTLWKLSIPARVKIFIWRAFHNALPTQVSILFRAAKKLWKRFDSWENIKECMKDPLVDCLLSIYHSPHHQVLDVICSALWSSWRRRNEIMFGSKAHTVDLEWEEIGSRLYEFQSHRLVDPQICGAKEEGMSSRPIQPWIPPPRGTMKLNVDASIDSHMDFVRVGGVFKHHEWVVHGAFVTKLEGTFSPEIAKLLAIREGVRFAVAQNIHVEKIESDASTVVAVLRNYITTRFSGGVVEEIEALPHKDARHMVSYIPRSGNSVAHVL
ncbi:hypothetical protein Scep_025885 [Stephania cephalantha]|uniref:Reverse transcriptase zinc-binding domain-containing protein n=1 Tax=Stephania cephalantha TaxID=152367 RepID=A0AAP0EJ30_9MAGN